MNLKEFVEKYQGKYVDKYGNTSNVKSDKNYMGQCASLSRWYLNQLGDNYKADSYGNAKDYINIPNKQIIGYGKQQDGDLVVWTGGQYGHIGIWYAGKVFNQNPHHARLDNIGYLNTWGLGNPIFVRPKLKQGVLENRKPKFDIGTYITTSNMNVRVGTGTQHRIRLVKELTKDGQKNATSNNPNDNAVYKVGTVFNAINVYALADNSIWAKTPSGFICLYINGVAYAKKK